jgi:hypothetical protein|eukprot:6346101-Prymnesium_polylepis.2
MNPAEQEAREEAADEIFARVASVLAAGLPVRQPILANKDEDTDEEDYLSILRQDEKLTAGQKLPKRIRFA